MEINSIKICAPELYSNVSYNVFSIYLLTPTDTVYHNDIKMTTLKVKYYGQLLNCVIKKNYVPAINLRLKQFKQLEKPIKFGIN